jgi:hypothetical protein
MALHFQKQMSQEVGTVRTSPAAALPAMAWSVPEVPAARVAAPAPNPAIFRKRRREILFIRVRPRPAH